MLGHSNGRCHRWCYHNICSFAIAWEAHPKSNRPICVFVAVVLLFGKIAVVRVLVLCCSLATRNATNTKAPETLQTITTVCVMRAVSFAPITGIFTAASSCHDHVSTFLFAFNQRRIPFFPVVVPLSFWLIKLSVYLVVGPT